MRFTKLAGIVSRGDILVAFLLIGFGYITRIIPHLDNFSPMIGIALCSGYYFRRNILSWVVPLVTIVLTDLHIGFYGRVMVVVWLSYVAMAFVSRRFVRNGSFAESFWAGLAGAVGFFVITNFAVWADGHLYAMTWQGLVECYVAAVPFFRATLISAVLYSVGIFSIARVGSQLTHAVQARLGTE